MAKKKVPKDFYDIILNSVSLVGFLLGLSGSLIFPLLSLASIVGFGWIIFRIYKYKSLRVGRIIAFVTLGLARLLLV